MPGFLACYYHDELSRQLPSWEGFLPIFHVAIENRNRDRRFWKYWLVFWGGESDFFLLSVTQKETSESYQEFKGRYEWIVECMKFLPANQDDVYYS